LAKAFIQFREVAQGVDFVDRQELTLRALSQLQPAFVDKILVPFVTWRTFRKALFFQFWLTISEETPELTFSGAFLPTQF